LRSHGVVNGFVDMILDYTNLTLKYRYIYVLKYVVMIKSNDLESIFNISKNKNIERLKFNLQAIAYFRILIQRIVFGHRLELNTNE